MTRHSTVNRRWLPVSLVSVLAAACSSGGGSGAGQPMGPSISSIAAQSVNQDTSIGPVAFAVTGAPGTSGELVVTASSSNPAIIQDGNITIAGSGMSRTITLTPVADAFGTVQIVLTAKDAAGRMARGAFAVNVNPVYASFTTTTDTAFVAGEDTQPVPITGVTLQPDADDNGNAFASLIQ